MQDNNVSYTILKDKIQEKKSVLNGWLSTSSALTLDQHINNNLNSTTSCSYAWGPSLSKYIQLTLSETYGAFSIDTKNRQIAEQNCRSYIKRFLIELDRRFPISKIQESLSSLFIRHIYVKMKNVFVKLVMDVNNLLFSQKYIIYSMVLIQKRFRPNGNLYDHH